jgi:hypothetical protein
MLAVCPACNSVVETKEAEPTVSNHNSSRHDGDEVAQVIDEPPVDSETVNELVDASREFSREQHERFIRTAMDDPRFEVMNGDQ